MVLNYPEKTKEYKVSLIKGHRKERNCQFSRFMLMKSSLCTERGKVDILWRGNLSNANIEWIVQGIGGASVIT